MRTAARDGQLLMHQVTASIIVLLVGVALAARALRPFTARERWLLSLGFAAHIFAACAQVWITHGYYGKGDMTSYFVTGTAIAEAVRYSPSQFVPELIALLVHRDSAWPFYVFGAGSSTGTVSAISGLLQVFLGESIYAVCIALSVAAFFGQLALYIVFRELYPACLRSRLVLATMLVPSVVFWSSGILKETVAMAAFGWVILGLHRFVQRRRIVGIGLIVVAGFWIALVKAYILFALGIAAVVWWYWRRSLESSGGRGVVIRPSYLLMGVGVVIGLMVVLGDLFPQYAIEQVGEETARLQRVGARIEGGSNYATSEGRSQSLLGQLAFAPLALLTALFRPAIFEVNNAMMAINALETTAITVLFVLGLIRRSWSSLLSQLLRSPTLIFAVVFIMTFGVAVGLATTNLGTLSRYRVPLMPFFAVLVLVWTARGDALGRTVRPTKSAPLPREPLRSRRIAQ